MVVLPPRSDQPARPAKPPQTHWRAASDDAKSPLRRRGAASGSVSDARGAARIRTGDVGFAILLKLLISAAFVVAVLTAAAPPGVGVGARRAPGHTRKSEASRVVARRRCDAAWERRDLRAAARR